MNKPLLSLLASFFIFCRISAQPVASVNPASLNATINSCNDSTAQTLTIYNTGTSVLNYGLSAPDVPLDSVLARINQNYTAITNEIPGIYFFSEGDFGNNISDGGNDMYDNGNYLNTDQGSFLNYSDNSIFYTDSMGLGGKYFTRKNSGLFVFAADVNNLSYFEITGNNGADGMGSVDTSRLTITKFGKNYTGFIKRVYNAGDPSINHLVIIESDTAVSHTYSTNTNDDQHRLTGISSVTRIYYLLYASSAGAYIDDLNTLNIFNSFIDVIITEPQWVTFSPGSGTIAAADSSVISLEFKSEFLNSGIYNSTIYVISNDPVNDTISVPVTMTVDGIPEIALSDTLLDYDTVLANGTYPDTLFIPNSGCDTLFLTNVSISGANFTVDTFTAYILPGETGGAIVTFTPPAAGPYTGTLTIQNNAADTVISLNGVALPPPVINVVPLSFNVVINDCNDSTTQTLTITNSGSSDLIYNIELTTDETFDYGYICNSGSNTVSVLNTNTNTIVATVPVGTFPWRTAIRPDGKYAYICNRNSSNISVIETSSNTVTATIAVGGNPAGIAITPDSRYAYVSDRSNNNVRKIDLITNTVIATINNANFSDPRDIDITPDGSRAFVATNNTGLTIINLSTDIVIGNIPSSGTEQLHSVVITPDGTLAYFSEPDNNTVRAVNTSTLTVVATIAGFDHPQGLDITPAGDFVYVNNMWNSQIIKISLSTNSIVNTIWDGQWGSPWDIVVSSDGQFAYFSDPWANNVTLIDLSTFTLNGILPGTGTGCRGMATLKKLYPSYINLSISTDTVIPSDSSVVNVEFNALNLNSGTYISDINIYSNDPANPWVAVPCTLTVLGSPEMSFVNVGTYLGDPYLPVDSILIGANNTDTFYIKNSGCDTLSITDINNTLAAFSISDTSPDILPGDSAILTVTFTPDTSGDYYDSLIIYNNQNIDTVIYLFDVGLPPPVLSFTPDTFNITLSCGDSLVDTLKIYNNGASDLIYSLTPSSEGTSGTITYSEDFVIGQTPTTQATAWVNFRQQLTPRPYKSLKVSGSNNSTGVTLTDVTAVNNIANAMNTMTNYSVFTQGNTWNVSVNGCASGIILTVNAPICNCDGANPNYYVIRPEIGNNNWGGINTVTCNAPSQTMTVEFTYGTPFMELSQSADTVIAGDSSIVTVSFDAGGLNVGTYTGLIAVSSNDPSNSADTVPVILNITGTAEVTLSENCLYLDSIMEFTTKSDSLFIKNSGCDTLLITNITSQTANFLFTFSSDTVLPGDSAKLEVTFVPTSTGNFFDTLTVFTNVGDSLICLSGKAYSRPIQSVFPDTINVTLACSDTLVDTLTIYNTGLTDLIFSTGISGKSLSLDGSGDWVNRNITNLPIGSIMTVSAWIYPQGYADASYNGVVSWGGRFCTGTAFVLSIQNNGRPSMATWCKDFVPGTGAAATLNQWNHIACVLNGNTVTLYMNGTAVTGTLAAGLPNVQSYNFAIGATDYPGRYFNGKIDEVRIYNTALTQAEILDLMNKQAVGNETGLMSYYNFDDGTATDLTANTNDLTFNGNATTSSLNAPVVGPVPSWLDYNLITDTVATGDSAKVPLTISSTGLIVNQYTSSVLVSSNDPLNSIDTVTVILDVIGAPQMVVSDSCLSFDTIMEFTDISDTFYITNTGCDTLFISGETSLNFFIDSLSIDSAGGYVLPGDTELVLLFFAPDSTGNFTGTLTLNTNDYDTVICLNGVSFPRPVISFDPDTISVVAACGDTLTVPLVIYNTSAGSTDLTWNLNLGNYAVNFDGSNDHITVPSGSWFNSSTNTIEAWVYARSYNNWSRIVDFGNGASNNNVLIALSQGGSGRVQYEVYNGGGSGGSVVTPTAIPLNQWVHVAVVQNGTSVTIYKDGVVWTTGTTAIPNNVVRNNNYIARSNWGFDAYANAIYDEVRIWNTARTQQEIAEDMNREIASQAALKGYWKFNEGTGTTAFDSSPAGQNGTLVNGAYFLTSTAPITYPVSLSISGGTTASGSSDTVNVVITSTGLIIGTYNYRIAVNSNDPLNSSDTVPVILNVFGTPEMVISDTCVLFDTIMELTSIADTFYITNTGCDTLFISSETSLNFYIDSMSIDSTGSYILPGDTDLVLLFFAPDSAGNFTGTLTLNTNDYDTVVCLNGVAFPRPVLDVIPDTFNVTLTCADSITLPLTIVNNGLSDLDWTVIPPSGLTDDFDPGIDGSLWLSTTGAVANTLCGSISGNALMFNGNITREAITKDLNTINVPTLDFYLKISGGFPGTCEQADFGENVMLSYSTNGGLNWTTIATYTPGSYNNFTQLSVTIPPAAKTLSTRFRWNQTNHSGSCCDHWALDDVSIDPIQFLTIAPPLSATTLASDSDTVSVTFNSTGLIIGQYSSSIVINSNDPLNPQVTVPAILTVVGAPTMVLSDSCIAFDTIMEFTTAVDSIMFTNTGCDTLFASAVTSANFYIDSISVDSVNGSLLPGDTAWVLVYFAPDSAGAFTGTLTFNTNDIDTVICLTGVAFQRPVLGVSPDTINATITVCQDSVVVPVTIYNTGGSDLTWNIVTTTTINDDFDPGINNPIWSVNNGIANTICGSVSGNALFFNDNGNRIAATVGLNTTGGGSINFSLKISGSGGACEQADGGEGVYLQYSNDGGSTWPNIAAYNPGAYNNFTSVNVAIPAIAKTSATRFRWSQPSHSGSCCDHWALDNISITVANPNIIVSPSADTTAIADSSVVNVTLTDTNLTGGNYTFEMVVYSNDPLNSSDTVIVNLFIDSVPPTVPVAADTAICFGNPTPDLVAYGDSIRWYSDGALTTLVFSGDIFATGKTTVGIYTYYVTNTDTVSGCQSEADTVILTINTVPTEPEATDTVVCSSSTIPDLISTGTMVNWYSDAALTNLVFTGTLFSTGQTIAGVYTYYVTDSVAGCAASPADTSTLTINNAAVVDAGTDTAICEGSTYTLAGTSGGGTSLFGWTTSGTGTFDDDSILTAAYTPSGADISAGNVTLTITKDDPDGAGPCSFVADSMLLTINTVATVDAGVDSTICGSTAYTLAGAMGGSTSSITWTSSGTGAFDNPNLTTATYTASAGDINSGSVILTINSDDPAGPCPAASDAMTLSLNIPDSVNAGADEIICSGAALTLNGTKGGSTVTVLWTTSGDGTFDDASLVNATYTHGTNDSTLGSITLTITSDDPAGPCNAVSDSMTITINATPAAPSAADTTVCSDAIIPNLTASGTNIIWYSDSALTTAVSTGNSFNTGQTAPGSYTYWLTDSLASCPASAADSATLTINQAATVNAGSDTTICKGSAITLSGVMGGSASTVTWTTPGNGAFDDATLLAATYTPGATDIATGSVSLTITTNDPDAAGPCSAISDNMIITINPPATVNAGSDATICQGSSHTLAGAIGGGSASATWSSIGDGTFDNASLLTAKYTPGSADISAGTVSLVLTSDDPAGPCSAVTDTMTITINIAATVNAGADTAICVGNSITLNGTRGGSATSSTWTTSGDGTFGDASSLAAVYTPGTNDNTNGTVTLVITSNDPDAGGPCSAVTDTMVLTINAAPSEPTAIDTAICAGETTPNLTASGTIVQWYSDGALTNLVFKGASFASGESSPGTFNYYVTDSVPGCPASSADTSTLVINSLPAAPSASADTAICDGSVVPDLIATGDSIRWYDDGALTNLVSANDTFATGISATGIYTYYATQTNLATGCQSPSDTITLTINAVPSAPVTSDETICFGTATPDLAAAGTNIQWYSDAGLTTLVFSGDSFATGKTAAGVYTYYATQTVTNCESPASTVILTINATPAAPAANDTSVCEDSPNPPLIASGTNIQWFGDSTLAVPIFGGDTFISGETVPGSYTYYANQTINACPGPGTAAILTIKPIPAAPVSSDTAICFGNPVPDLNAAGTNLQWYSDAGLTTLVGTGSPFTTGDTAIGSYTYYVTDSLNDCGAGPATAVTLTIDTLPVPPATTDASSCFGDSVPSLTASGLNIQWYSDAGLTNMVFAGDTFATGDAAAGTYTYYATSTSAACGESSADSATLTINAVPGTPVTTGADNCFGSATASLIASGTNVQWYSDSALTSLVFSGNNFTPADSSVGTFTYYATQTDTVTGCVGNADSVTLTINALPSAPVSSDTTIVYGNPIPDFTATGTNVQWYSDSALTILEGSGNNFSSGDTAVGSYSYFVTQSDTGTGCESGAISVTLAILPGAPTALGSSSCEGDSIAPLSASGTNILWYSDAALTILVGSGDTFTPADSIAGTYIYYATQTVNGFESPSTSATLVVNALPSAPVVSNDTAVCENDVIPVLFAGGTNINWYDDAGLTSLVASGDSLATGQTIAGNYVYYATQTVLGCEGTADSVMLTITANPAAPVAADSSTCFGNAVPDLFASGTNVLWYSDSGLTSFEFAGNIFTTGNTAAGTYTYYVVDTMNGCTSAYTLVNLLISLPANAPLSAGTSTDPTCPGAPTTLNVSGILSTGTLWKWYSANCGGTMEGIGDSIVVSPLTTTSYFVRAEGGCDTTSCVNVVVNVTNTLSTAASGSTTDVDSICPGTTATLSVNGGSLGTGANWQWYSAGCGGTSIGSGSSVAVTPSSTTTYYVRAEGICNTTACDSVTVTIDMPAAPLANSETVCEGQVVPDLAASGTNINWYSDSALTNNVFTGNTFSSGDSAAGVYTYYATETNAVGCEGPATAVVLTINAIPSAPPASDEIGCEGGIIPDLVSTGTFIQWYSDAGLTALVASGDTFATGQINTGIYTYYVTDSVTGCEGPSSAVTLTINAIPFSPVTSSGSGCSGDSIASVFATGTNIQWYADSAQTIFVSSGDTLKPGLLPPGTYTYYAIQTVNGCESPVDSSLLTVFASPSAPASSGETVCDDAAVPDLVATGANINWYDDSLLTNNVFTGDTFATGNSAAGVYTYYATETQNGCASAATAVTLTINAIPASPVTSDETACASGIIPDLTAAGTSVNWYSDSALTVPAGSGNTLTTGQTAIGSYTYYATETVNGCTSSAAPATLSINAIPSAPAGNNVTVCSGAAVPDLSVSGSNITWYSEPMLIIEVGTGNNLATGKTQVGTYTYYATQTVNGCTSAATAVSLSINPNPQVTLNTYSTTITAGQSVTLIAYNAGIYSWAPPAGLNTTTNDTVIASPDSTTTYTVTGSNALGCSNAASVTVNVNPVDIEELASSRFGFEVYPNPNKGEFMVQLSNQNRVTEYRLQIFNMLGEIVYEAKIENLQSEVNLKRYGSGVYYVQVVSERDVVTKRVVIE